MNHDKLNIIIGLTIFAIGGIITFYVVKKFNEKLAIFTNDLLKEKQADGYWKWSRNSMMMFQAWYCCMFVFIADFIKNDYKANETLFWGMLGIATTGQIASAYAKKINPLVREPKENISDEQKS